MLRRPPIALLTLATLSLVGTPLRAESEFAEHLTLSTTYRLTVAGDAVRVLETTKSTNHGTHDVRRMSFAGFDCVGEVPVEVEVRRPFQTVAVRPRRAGIQLAREGNRLRLTLKPLQHITLVFDNQYDDTLVISANPPHVPPQPQEVDHYFGPGVHRMAERLKLASGQRVYLAEGAIVCGAFDLTHVEDVRIFGRGIVYGGETPHQENYRVFAGDATKNITIEGVTVCNAPGWIISFWSGSERLTVRNVKMLGNFRYNTDGVQTGTRGLLVENCYLQCNDDNFSLNGVCRDVVIRNNVLWNLYNGGVFMLGWATGKNFHLENIRIHDNTILRCGGCCDYDRKAPFSMKLFGASRIARDIEFRNIDVEEIAAFGRWIDLQAAKGSKSQIGDIHFTNINIDKTWLTEGEIRGNREAGVEVTGVSFRNVRLGGKLLDSPEVGQLSLVDTRGTLLEGQVFADRRLPAQPLPGAVEHRTTRPAAADGRGGSSAPPRLASAKNMLPNGAFKQGLKGWISSAEAETKVVKQADALQLLISDRESSASGIACDVTQFLKQRGPGPYLYGVVAKAVQEPLHVKATLIIEDAEGTQQHPSPDLLVDAKAFATASRSQSVSWKELKRATLRVESGYGDKHDLLIREVFLKR